MSAGAVAVNLDALYDYILRRLVAGNVAKDPAPTEEALGLLRSLLEAWQQVARQGAAVATSVPAGATPSPAAAAREYAAALRGAA
jgi:flagellar protein FliS